MQSGWDDFDIRYEQLAHNLEMGAVTEVLTANAGEHPKLALIVIIVGDCGFAEA